MVTEHDKRSSLLSHFNFSVVLIERVQATHLQGQDDPDHQVWNQGYKSKYVVLKDEAGNGELKNKRHALLIFMLRQKSVLNYPAMSMGFQVFIINLGEINQENRSTTVFKCVVCYNFRP